MQEKYFNRELSWIEFNARVLNEAIRKDNPLLERVNFLSITSSNFDEFFQVRVASLKRLVNSNPSSDAKVVLKNISKRCHALTKLSDDTLLKDVIPALARAGMVYVSGEHYSQAEEVHTESIFRHDFFPVLTPLRTDGDEFPHIGNLGLNAAFILTPKTGLRSKQTVFSAGRESTPLALVPIPSSLPRIIFFPEENDGDGKVHKFTTLEDIITRFGMELFPGYEVKESLLFKVARDADFAVDEDSGENFIQAMREVLVKRESSFAVRMVCNSSSPAIRELIQKKLSLSNDDVYEVKSLLDPGSLRELFTLEGASTYLYPEWKHFPSPALPEEGTYWNTLRQHDVLLNVPYESYDPVVKFIRDAAKDEGVLAIKMTLYRTGNNSPIVHALEEAAQNGKQVTVFVELKARFDERRNITWADELEKAGAIVVYGVVNLKVHAKLCLIVRRESDGIRRYLHLSTGNYNTRTSLTYQDLSIFTTNHDLAGDATLFFNVISGYSAVQTMHHLFMAPVTLKSHLLELIDREMRQSTPENPGLIVAKMNSLCHKEIIDKLYQASCAGVKILLNVRGICTLVPGLPNLSENITVVSIVDRYLEHSRMCYFKNGGSEEMYLSSADWMERNLDKRIELLFPITDKVVFNQIKEMFTSYFSDNTHSYKLLPDGSWKKKEGEKNEKPFRVQEAIYQQYKKRNDARKSLPSQEFVVRRKD